MKKFLVVLLFLSIFLSPSPVEAASTKTYSIENLVINATISENGDVYVEEELSYYFKGNFNGIYRNFSKKGAKDITISAVLLEDHQGNISSLKENQGSNNNYYELDRSGSVTNVKIFSKSNNERKKFTIKYTIHGAVVKRENLGELNWAFYEVENNVAVNNFALNLSLKNGNFDMSIFKHWGYIDGKDLTDSYNEKGFQMKGKNLTGKLGVKVHFQPEYLNIPITKKGRGSATGLAILAVIFISILAIVNSMVKKNKKYKAAVEEYRSKYLHFNGDLVTMAPSEMPPALVNLLINENYISHSVLSATLYYLCHKGYYTLAEDSHSKFSLSKRKKGDLVFRRNYQKSLPASEHLRNFIKWMSKYELNGQLSLKAIKNKVNTRSGALDFKRSYSNWENIIKREARELGFYVSIENRRILSNVYYDEKLKWLAYKKYLLTFVNNTSREEVDRIDEVLIYASVLIANDNQLEKLVDRVNNSYHPRNRYNNNFFYYYYPFFMANHTMWDGINYDIDRVSTSDDGSGFGGFSSGSSFTGGGGGGSGAF
ncbi:MAG: DUF2207 domain-containing protein [Clostridia bacterium]|nr:DUF2207 domain-containing protein [Clostridia bacterium]